MKSIFTKIYLVAAGVTTECKDVGEFASLFAANDGNGKARIELWIEGESLPRIGVPVAAADLLGNMEDLDKNSVNA